MAAELRATACRVNLHDEVAEWSWNYISHFKTSHVLWGIYRAGARSGVWTGLLLEAYNRRLSCATRCTVQVWYIFLDYTLTKVQKQ
jgi:hypothetical protein